MSATDKTERDTVYVVLQKMGGQGTADPESYKPLGEFPASGDIKAIDLAAEQNHLEDGKFVGVPVRSFRERTLTTEKTPKRRVK